MAGKTKQPKKRLGKGLGGLLSQPVAVPIEEHDRKSPQNTPDQPLTQPEQGIASQEHSSSSDSSKGTELVYLNTASLTPNPYQPRQVFDDDALSSLAGSITTAGLMQPVIVRPSKSSPDMYELIAGERRWRAATIAGLTTIPAIVRELDDRTSAEWSLIENLQREDLNPIDRAEAFDHLIVKFEMTQHEIATQLGIDRSSVANFIRLNDLDPSVKDAVRDGRLSMGHAKVLLSIADNSSCKAMARKCAQQQWSVRELERQLKRRTESKKPNSKQEETDPQAMYMEHLSEQLGAHLGTQVQISLGKKKGSGKLSIAFYDNEQFEGLLDKFQFTPKS